jgi:hypothetical protein
MANTTPGDIEKSSLSEEIKRELKVLRNAPTMFNAMDLIPSECTWYILLEDMERYVRQVAEEFLGREEIRTVTIEPGLKGSRVPRTYIWLKRDSKHLVDKSRTVSADLVINPQMDRYSDELKRFADRFAPTHRDDGSEISRKKLIQIVQNIRDDHSIVGIPVDIVRVLQRLFDSDNRGFQDAYGSEKGARRCRVEVACKYNNKGERLALTAFKVTKYLEGSRGSRVDNRPIPRFTDRRYEDD